MISAIRLSFIWMGIHSSRPLFRKGQRRSTAGAAGPAASQCGKGHGHHFCPIQIRGTEFPLRPDGLALRVICSPVRGTLRFPSARGAGSPPTALLPLRRELAAPWEKKAPAQRPLFSPSPGRHFQEEEPPGNAKGLPPLQTCLPQCSGTSYPA